MLDPPGAVEVRWALFGKPPRDRHDYRVLACSDGPERCLDFYPPARAGVSVAARDATSPQQVSFMPWEYQGLSYIGVTVIDPSGHNDGDGRPITEGRFFAFPATWALESGISFSGLYDTVREVRLSSEDAPGLLKLDVATQDLLGAAQVLHDHPQMGAWLIRLAGTVMDRSVVVTRAPSEFDQRLAALDVVAALLPAWARSHISATTWADKPRKEFSLAFGETAERGQVKIPWGEEDGRHGAAGGYADLLGDLCWHSYGVEPVLAYLASLHTPPRSGTKADVAELATTDLAVLTSLVTFDPSQPPDSEHLSEVAALGQQTPVHRWPPEIARRIEGFVLDAAIAEMPKSGEALSSVWSPWVADAAAHAAIAHLAFGHTGPALVMLLAAWGAGEADSFLRQLVNAAMPVNNASAELSLASAPLGQDSLVELLRLAARTPSLLVELHPALREADTLSRRVVAAVARDQADATVAFISALLPGVSELADSAGAPAWLRLLAPWSRPVARALGSGNSAWPGDVVSELDLGAIPAIWAVANALRIPDLVDLTWEQLINLSRYTPGAPTLSDLSGWPAYGWALTERFGQKLSVRTRAHADMARIAVGLAPADAPGPEEAGLHIDRYVEECLHTGHSEIFTAEASLRLRKQLSDYLLAPEDTTLSRAAERLLDRLADSPYEDDREWLVSQLGQERVKRPGGTKRLRKKSRKLRRALARSSRGTAEAAAAGQLRLEIRALASAEAEMPDTLNSLADAAAGEGFGHQNRSTSAQVVLRELRAWPGHRHPEVVHDLLGRWEAELRHHGLAKADAQRKIRDARSEILSGIWGSEVAREHAMYYSGVVALRKLERNREIDEATVEIHQIDANIKERQAEIGRLQREIGVIRARIDQLQADIEGYERFGREISRLFPADGSR